MEGRVLPRSPGMRKCGIAKEWRKGQCGWNARNKKEETARVQGPGGVWVWTIAAVLTI